MVETGHAPSLLGTPLHSRDEVVRAIMQNPNRRTLVDEVTTQKEV